MKLSISNLGWDISNTDEILEYISKKGYQGLEIAPTIFMPNNPYEHIEEYKKITDNIYAKYHLIISSMQSIWFGKSGNIFSEEDAKELMEYTKKAIDFASAIGCKNLVFGNPKNRTIPTNKIVDDIIYFFKELGDYAYSKNTVLSLEANPTIYNTNFMNYTKEAFDFVKRVNSKGFKVNIDFGTIVENKEDLDVIAENIDFVNHIHISEPNLLPIQKRMQHKQLAKLLVEHNYDKFISIEMKNNNNLEQLKEIIDYVYEIFH